MHFGPENQPSPTVGRSTTADRPQTSNPSGVAPFGRPMPASSRTSRLWSHITIEPLAFLAIFALYIELPSTQDLIYTKICLQTLANHSSYPIEQHYQTASRLEGQSEQFESFNRSTTTARPAPKQQETTVYSLDVSEHIPPKLPQEGRILPSPSTINDNLTFATTSTPPPSPSPAVTTPEPAYIDHEHFACDRLNKSAIPEDLRDEVIRDNSLFWLKYQLIISVLCALSGPYWGGLSDSFGRLIPINAPVVAAIVSNMISLIFGVLISLEMHESVHVEWLYLGAIVVGLSGGQAVLIANSFSYLSDNTDAEQRSKRVVTLESIIYLSHGLGFYLAKQIMSIKLSNPIYAGLAGAVWFNRHFVAFASIVILNLVACCYSYFRLRRYRYHRFLNNFEREQLEHSVGVSSSTVNSLADGKTKSVMGGSPISENRFTPHRSAERLGELTTPSPDDSNNSLVRAEKRWLNFGSILTLRYYKETYDVATRPRECRAILCLLLLCGFISAMSLTCLMSLLFVYLKADPFNWTTSQYSAWNSYSSASRGLALIMLSLGMKFCENWSLPDALVSVVGFLSKGVGLLMIATAQSSTLIDWSLAAFVLSEYSMPPIRSQISKLVISEELGKVYSCLAALQGICFIAGNVLFYLAITSLEVKSVFRLSFLTVAGTEFTAAIIMLFVWANLRRRVIVT